MAKIFTKKDKYFKTGEEFTRPYTGKEILSITRDGVKKSWKKFNFIYIFVVIFLIYLFSALSTFNWNLATNILYSTVTIGIISLGMGLIILTGDIDLSVGSSFAFIAGLSVLSYNTFLESLGNGTVALILTMFIAIILGIAVGFINGIFVGKMKMPSFIVTLATMLIWRSLIQFILSIQEGKPSTFRVTGYGTDNWYWLGNFSILSISLVGIMFIVIGIIIWLIMKYSKFGRKVYAVGSNAKAANLVGISSSWIRVAVFTIAGLLIGFAAFLQVAMRGSVDPSSTGNSFELYAIASVVLGGISMSGGKGNIAGVIFGALAFQTIDKIIAALQLNPNLNDTIKGVILIVAVFLQVFKISKEDVQRFFVKIGLKYTADIALILESEEKTEIETLNKKYLAKAKKINSNTSLSYDEIKSKIADLFKERDEKIKNIKEVYTIKIDNAKLKVARHTKKSETESKVLELESHLENQKFYDEYLIKNKSEEVSPNIYPVLVMKKELTVSRLEFEKETLSQINEVKKDYSLEKEQLNYLLSRGSGLDQKKKDKYLKLIDSFDEKSNKCDLEYQKSLAKLEEKSSKELNEIEKEIEVHKNDKEVPPKVKVKKDESSKSVKVNEKENSKAKKSEELEARLNKILEELEEK